MRRGGCWHFFGVVGTCQQCQQICWHFVGTKTTYSYDIIDFCVFTTVGTLLALCWHSVGTRAEIHRLDAGSRMYPNGPSFHSGLPFGQIRDSPPRGVRPGCRALLASGERGAPSSPLPPNPPTRSPSARKRPCRGTRPAGRDREDSPAARERFSLSKCFATRLARPSLCSGTAPLARRTAAMLRAPPKGASRAVEPRFRAASSASFLRFTQRKESKKRRERVWAEPILARRSAACGARIGAEEVSVPVAGNHEIPSNGATTRSKNHNRTHPFSSRFPCATQHKEAKVSH